MKHVFHSILAAALLLLTASTAQAAEPSWLRSHMFFEVTAGPAWRVSISRDDRVPGFQAVTVGGELVVGLELGAGFSVITEGGGRWGRSSGQGYAEATGSLGGQLRLGERVRIRLGANAGEAWLTGVAQTAALVGGWLEASLGIVSLGSRGGICFSLRLDVGGVVDGAPNFPSSTLGLAAGIGGYY